MEVGKLLEILKNIPVLLPVMDMADKHIDTIVTNRDGVLELINDEDDGGWCVGELITELENFPPATQVAIAEVIEEDDVALIIC
jgi:hypothetical protein